MKRPALINPPLAEGMCALVLGQPAPQLLGHRSPAVQTIAALTLTSRQPLTCAQTWSNEGAAVRVQVLRRRMWGLWDPAALFFPSERKFGRLVARGLAHFSHKL